MSDGGEKELPNWALPQLMFLIAGNIVNCVGEVLGQKTPPQTFLYRYPNRSSAGRWDIDLDADAISKIVDAVHGALREVYKIDFGVGYMNLTHSVGPTIGTKGVFVVDLRPSTH